MAAAAIDALFCWFVCLFVFFLNFEVVVATASPSKPHQRVSFFLSVTFFYACVRLRFHAAKDKWSRRGAIERPNKSKKRRAATPSRSAPMKRYRRVVDADVHVDVVDVVDVVDATRNGRRKRTKYDDEIEQSVADAVDAVIVVVADVVAVVFFWRRGSVGKRKARKSTPKTKKKGRGSMRNGSETRPEVDR